MLSKLETPMFGKKQRSSPKKIIRTNAERRTTSSGAASIENKATGKDCHHQIASREKYQYHGS